MVEYINACYADSVLYMRLTGHPSIVGTVSMNASVGVGGKNAHHPCQNPSALGEQKNLQTMPTLHWLMRMYTYATQAPHL